MLKRERQTVMETIIRQPLTCPAAMTVMAAQQETNVSATRAQRPELLLWTRVYRGPRGRTRRCGQQQHWASYWFSSPCQCFTHACTATGGSHPVFTGTTHSKTTTAWQVGGVQRVHGDSVLWFSDRCVLVTLTRRLCMCKLYLCVL